MTFALLRITACAHQEGATAPGRLVFGAIIYEKKKKKKRVN